MRAGPVLAVLIWCALIAVGVLISGCDAVERVVSGCAAETSRGRVCRSMPAGGR